MIHSRLGKLFTVLLAGVLGGLLLALAALPAMTLYGFGLNALTAPYGGMSGDLPTPPPAQRSTLYAADGRTVITTFYEEDRTDVPLSAVAPVMRQAMVAAEDTRFYAHHGVDLRGVLRAFVANRLGGDDRQGASTLTMQYVRNVRKSDPNLTEAQRAAATETTVGRKLQEMRYAVELERKLSKDEILGRYLNIAYFGAGAYGIAAASYRYFGKRASELTLAEAALLAGLVRAPDYYDPINGDAAAAVQRRGYVLDQMVAMGVLAPADAARARGERLALRPRSTTGECVSAKPEDWGFFCDWFRQWWSTQPAFGATPADRLAALRRGGYRITASIDPDIQATAVKYANWVYDQDNPRALPIAVVQPGTGRVLALAVNRHYQAGGNPAGQENYPNTVNQLVAGGGDIEGYQAGSTFKLFTMLAALEQGMPLASGFNAPAWLMTNYPVTGRSSCGGYWCPVNSNPEWMDGYRTMWSAFGRSVNTYFAHLIERVGADQVVAMAQRLGIQFRAANDATMARTGAKAWGPFTFGVASTTPLDLANAYATVAAEGMYCAPRPVVSIIDPAGRRIAAADPDCRRALSTE
ncbi:transglycosylase domain-containing protein, partial [Micromonospora zhanjiangensis]